MELAAQQRFDHDRPFEYKARSLRTMKRVIVYRRSILPPSETFIKQQIVSLSVWGAVLAGHERVQNRLDTKGLNLLIEKDFPNAALDRLRRRLFQRLGWPAFGFYKKVKDYDASLVHVHFGVDVVSAWPWLRHLGIPVVVTLHGYDISIKPSHWQRGQDKRMKDYPAKLRNIARHERVSIIAVSNAIRQKAIDLYDLPAEKIKVLYIGVDEKAFTPIGASEKCQSKKILFVGRLVEKKGAAILIRAMREVCRQVPDCELDIVGDGPLRESLESLAEQLQISVRFLGTLDSDSVRNRMKASRVFCLPSITAENGDAEGFGIVLLEAQACGLPVVTSAAGGREEGIVDGVTGFAFDEGDVEGLAAHLVRLLTDDDLARRMSDAGPLFIARRFSLEKCTARLESYYDSIANAHAAVP